MEINFLNDLEWRGLIYQKTPGIENVFNKGATIYYGVDATADSLHFGHLLGYLVLKRAYEAGHNIIVLMATGTAAIGDPSGKDAERPIVSKDILAANKEKLSKQVENFFKIDGKRVKTIDNAEWLEKLSLIDFLRDTGKYISANSMMDMESVKTRLSRQEGISYAEFSYQLLQAYDFLRFYEDHQCEVQIGGSDQWGNMIQGVELIRKKISREAHVLSYPLIVDPKTGKKFGKTEKGAAIWLDPEKTPPFAFYQFFINVEDELAPVLMKYYSFKSKEEIEELIGEWQKQKETRLIQKELAYELTEMVHGRELADQSKAVASILFERKGEGLTEKDLKFIKKSVPYTTLSSQNDLVLEEVLIQLGLVQSKNEARRLIEQKGVISNNLFNKYFLIRKGKKDYGIVEIV
ncbi:MAG: tyrosine--tRNA ligase [Candidatus Roizmanbacteria bacterium]|nr:MAG: tyrosine--tRNA ligase [Candidatus Roizmanbacteria bacterium]